MRGSRRWRQDADCRTARWPPGAARHLRRSFPFLLAALFVFLAREPLDALDWRAVRAAADLIPASAWGLAACATLVSYLALGRYDQAVHGALGTGVAPRQARFSGMAAIAIGQMAGAGLLTGTLTRWRMVPDLTLVAAGRVTLAVTLSFLASWAVVTATAILLLMPERPVLHIAASVVLAAFASCIVAALALPRLALPPLALAGRILLLCVADTLSAALALYLLFPQTPDFALFLPAFLLALGAGLCLGTPGGIGPFEMTLLVFLPGQPPESAAAAILCYRLIYHAVPALIAGAAAFLAEPGTDQPGTGAPGPWQALATGPAECLLHRQGRHRLFQTPDAPHAVWLTARAGQADVALLDPAGGPNPALLQGFAREARQRGLLPCLYKIGPRTALLARRAGWRLHALADEFWLTPATFTLDGANRATLRRKLRRAERAGLRIEPVAPAACGTGVPWHLMASVNAGWAARHGGERGFSMGRFDPAYLSGQRLYLAWSAATLVGFVSFHANAREWTLDLVRQTADAPDGAVHALIARALHDAGAAGIARLSLAAAPLPALGLTGRAARLATSLLPAKNDTGLRRFKESFAPQRTRLYLAAQGRPALLWAAVEIARAIHRPARLSRSAAPAHPVHLHPEKLAFDVS